MVEKNYLQIAKSSINRPKDIEGYRRFLIYARNKKGKTRFSLSAGISTTLLLDPEDGTDTMKQLNPYRWPIRKWTDLADAIGAIKTGKLTPKFLGLGPETVPFTWLSVDGLTRFNNIALRYIKYVREQGSLETKPGMVKRQDYFKSGDLMKELLIQLHALPINICYTSQERVLGGGDNDDPESEEVSTMYVPDLPASVRGAVDAWVECIGRLYLTTATFKQKGGGTIEKKQRRLWIASHESYDTGFRSDFELPDFIRNPSIPKLTSALLQGEV